MLFLLFGASASGKTFVLGRLRGRIANLAVHDVDPAGRVARALVECTLRVGRASTPQGS